MGKYSQTTDEQTAANLAYIDLRWKQLHDLEIRRSDTALNYLFLVSGGAAAATLTYIGNLTKEGTSVPASAFWMLGLFSFALLLVGLLKIMLTYDVIWIFKEWRTLVHRYYSDEMEWRDAVEQDGANVQKGNWFFHVLVWGAYFGITAGVAVGFFNLQEEIVRVRTEKAVSATTKTSEARTSTGTSHDQPRLDKGGKPPEVSRRSPVQPAATAAQKMKRGEGE